MRITTLPLIRSQNPGCELALHTSLRCASPEKTVFRLLRLPRPMNNAGPQSAVVQNAHARDCHLKLPLVLKPSCPGCCKIEISRETGQGLLRPGVLAQPLRLVMGLNSLRSMEPSQREAGNDGVNTGLSMSTSNHVGSLVGVLTWVLYCVCWLCVSLLCKSWQDLNRNREGRC